MSENANHSIEHVPGAKLQRGGRFELGMVEQVRALRRLVDVVD